MGRKHCGKSRNRSLWAIFSFCHSVFKRFVLQTRKNQGLFGKGLTWLFSKVVCCKSDFKKELSSFVSVYLSSLPVAHQSDAPRGRLVVTGDRARIQGEPTVSFNSLVPGFSSSPNNPKFKRKTSFENIVEKRIQFL